jgi:hypothetical protein
MLLDLSIIANAFTRRISSASRLLVSKRNAKKRISQENARWGRVLDACVCSFRQSGIPGPTWFARVKWSLFNRRSVPTN